tara:strand:- start:81 stop:812 length:732 start_codon:yes stop_codon:yes gene_type:complete
MSRANPNPKTFTSNPATVFLEWAAGQGTESNPGGYLKFWNKEEKKNEKVHSFTFAYLDERSGVGGFYPKFGSNAFSNEVKNTATEPLVVKGWNDGKAEVIKEGIYQEIKDTLLVNGIKYTKIVYGTVVESSNLALKPGTIFRLGLKGSGVSAWLDFKDKESGAIDVGFLENEKGQTKWKQITLSSVPISEDDNDNAIAQSFALDKFFLAERIKKDFPEPEALPNSSPVESETVPAGVDDDLPF